MLRVVGSSIDASALRAHDDQLKHSINDLLGCQISDTASIQSACGVRNGGLGLRRAQDLALPAFIASRTGAKAGVFALIGELFSDDIGDLLTCTFDAGLKKAIDDLKSRLSDGHATAVDTCLLEAQEQRVRSGLHLPV